MDTPIERLISPSKFPQEVQDGIFLGYMFTVYKQYSGVSDSQLMCNLREMCMLAAAIVSSPYDDSASLFLYLAERSQKSKKELLDWIHIWDVNDPQFYTCYRCQEAAKILTADLAANPTSES